MKKIFAIIVLATTAMHAQVTLTPAIVTQNDTVTITFNAAQGNAALVGVSPVYAHTGVITNLSTSPTDWRHVQGNWGTADPKVLMTSQGNNIHTLKYHINSFYNVPGNETVNALAFVFRNQAGNIVGRTSSGGDIFISISQGGYTAFLNSHTNRQYIYNTSDTMKLNGVASTASHIVFTLNGDTIAQANNAVSLNHNLLMNTQPLGFYQVVMHATDGVTSQTDTTHFLSRAGTPIGVLPAGAEEGINIINDSTVLFVIRAPFKDYMYAFGDFSDWFIMPENQMFKTPNGQFFWVEITGLDKNMEYGFQYYIGNDGMRITDPYAEKILDPWNDHWIPASTYPNLKTYPAGKTSEIVGVFQIEKDAYNWDGSYTYNRPAKEELVIYELLVRDFDHGRTYANVINRLDYLQWLGINAIQLLPVMEFEGNESWGYNPMFFFAADKFYGPRNELKRLVDSCHARGMAVILDIALNHSFGQNPMVRMYFDPSIGQYGEPTAQSPWFNQQPKHDFNVGYDFNHESQATKYFTKRVLQFWIEEYKIDGYRMDLSKGFTQRNTLGNIGAWNAYDQSRINILTDYANHVWGVDSHTYFILEHFADNSEETVLSNGGMMLWGNANHEYNEAVMGYNSNFAGVGHQSRNWNDMHLIGYMESHDEERIVFKTLQFGSSNTTYNTRILDTALQRVGAAAAFFYTIPGPKMLWQFGELGYDYSINHCTNGTIDPGCRLSNKPIRWDYFNDPRRKALFDVMGELNYLRQQLPIFSFDKQYQLTQTGRTKRLKLADSSAQVVVIGNFDIVPQNVVPAFHQNGWWYNHFAQDSMNVTDANAPINLKPGEFRLYTNVRVAKSSIGIDEVAQIHQPKITVYPTLFTDEVTFEITLPMRTTATVEVVDLTGSVLAGWQLQITPNETQTLLWDGRTKTGADLPAGVYLYRIQAGSHSSFGKLIKP